MSEKNTLNFTFNFHAPVGQNIAHVDRLEAHFDKDMTMQVVDTAAPARETDTTAKPLPEVLCTDKARDLHGRLCKAGMVDEEWMPVGLSFTEKGTLIDYVAERLDIRAKWKFFGTLWHTDPETLRTSKVRGLDQDKTWAFRSRLDAL